MQKLLGFLMLIALIYCRPAHSQNDINHYISLNEKETRLQAFKDSKEIIALKLKQVDYINKSRKKHKAPAVELDILASRMANQIAQEAVRNKYSGHFNLKGESPYIRFANCGGTDHVAENAAAASYSQPIEPTSQNISYNMQMLHNAFMAEKAPNNGHKKTCIEQSHNYIGIGYATQDNEFRYYEEYLDRYLIFKRFNSETTPKKELKLTFKPIRKGDIPYFIIVYQQPVPQPMTSGQIEQTESYCDYTDSEVLNLGPWEIPEPDGDGFTTLTLNFEKKGYYYVQIFLSDTPHKKGAEASTKGKTQASGVVIRVK